MEQELENIIRKNNCYENSFFRACYKNIFNQDKIQKLFVNFYALTKAFPIYGFQHCYLSGLALLENTKKKYLPTKIKQEEYLAVITEIISSEYSDGKITVPSKFHSNLFANLGLKLGVDLEQLKSNGYELETSTKKLINQIKHNFSNENLLAGFSVLFVIESTALKIIDSLFKAFQKFAYQNDFEFTEEELEYFSWHQILEIEHEEGVNEALKIFELDKEDELSLKQFTDEFSGLLHKFWKNLK